jgi:hypothetical protein
MKASSIIVSGRFCGAEIEPGTFHDNPKVSMPDEGGSERDLLHVSEPPIPPAQRELHTS